MKDLFGNHIETDEEKYRRKVNFAIKLLQSIPQNEGPVEISYSGGKDSDVILELAKMAGIPYRAIYKVTTIDPPGTIAHCKTNGVEILHPKKSFFELVRENGLPNRFQRFCCKYLKEYKVLDRAILGIRRSESTKRASIYKEPEQCRVYSKNEKVRQYLPILEWTDNDIIRFIEERNIKCHPLYYDVAGVFHVERRVGCIGCPLATQRKRIEQFLEYPKILKLLIKNLQIYLDSHQKTRLFELSNGSAYNKLYYELFCNGNEDYQRKITCGPFREIAVDPKKFLEDYFKIDLTI